MASDPANDFRNGDLDQSLLRKILNRMVAVMGAIETVTPTVVIEPGNVEIGSVVIKDGVGAALSSVISSPPAGTEPALVVRNIPSGTQVVSGAVTVAGTVAVSNFPATQPVSGSVTVGGTVAVSNLPATQPVSGSVAVTNFPATQPVSGSVSVSNFPATQPVSGSVTVAGTVAVSNFPATQPVSGTVTVTGSVAVSNFPATQTVAGSVSVSNFPAVQVVSDPTDIVNPLFAASRLGLVDGHAAESFHVMGRRAGFNSTSVLQDVGEWLGTSIDALPELTGVENLEVVSSNVNDTALGTGARTIRIGYIDTSNHLVVSPDISLNGTTPVAIAFKANFILWMETTSTGSSPVSEGNIILRIVGPGATQEQITAGGNRSLSARFMVPVGYTGYLVEWGVNAINTTQDARLRATVRTRSRTLGTDYVFQSVYYLASGANAAEDLPYLQVPALCKIKVSTIPGAAAAGNRIDSEFTILLIAN